MHTTTSTTYIRTYTTRVLWQATCGRHNPQYRPQAKASTRDILNPPRLHLRKPSFLIPYDCSWTLRSPVIHFIRNSRLLTTLCIVSTADIKTTTKAEGSITYRTQDHRRSIHSCCSRNRTESLRKPCFQGTEGRMIRQGTGRRHRDRTRRCLFFPCQLHKRSSISSQTRRERGMHAQHRPGPQCSSEFPPVKVSKLASCPVHLGCIQNCLHHP